MNERAIAIISRPDTMEQVVAHVTNGGSLITLCETWQVRYSDIMSWIRADVERSQQYDKAIGDRSEWVKERLLAELKVIGLVDVRRLFHADGSILPADQWPAEIAGAVSSVEVGEEKLGGGRTKKVRLWDKIAALRIIGMHEGIFVEKVKVEHDIAEDLRKARERSQGATLLTRSEPEKAQD